MKFGGWLQQSFNYVGIFCFHKGESHYSELSKAGFKYNEEHSLGNIPPASFPTNKNPSKQKKYFI